MNATSLTECESQVRADLLNEAECRRWLERKAGADLDLAAGGHRHRDGAELRSVDEAIGRAQVDFVHRVERFAAQLEIQLFGEAEVADQREVQRLQRRAVNRVSTGIPEGECGGGSEGS